MGQITARPENHQTLGCDDAFLTKSNPQGIGDRGDHEAQASAAGLGTEAELHSAPEHPDWCMRSDCFQAKKKARRVTRQARAPEIRINRFPRASGRPS